MGVPDRSSVLRLDCFPCPHCANSRVSSAYYSLGHRVIPAIRYAIRSLLKEKSFAFTVVLTLAVCIAANTATFAIVNSVLLRPLPVPDANGILLMSNRYPKAGVVDFYFSSAGDYYDRRANVTAFQEQAMFRFADQAIGINDTPEQVPGMATTPSLFRLLGIPPALGRTFNDAEGEIGDEQKVILSYGLWRRLYGASPDILGRELRLSGRPYTIVGVMPVSFSFIKPEVRFWIPLAFSAQEKTAHHSNNYYSIGTTEVECHHPAGSGAGRRHQCAQPGPFPGIPRDHHQRRVPHGS